MNSWYVRTAHRLGGVAATALVVTGIVFLLLHATPGDPARLAAGQDADDEAVRAAAERLGLDKPLPLQFVIWFSGLLRGDLGDSYIQSRSVRSLILERLPVTISLVLGALIIGLIFALTLGTLAAVKRGSSTDRGVVVTASLGISLPDFFIGVMLVFGLAVSVPLFPATGYVPLLQSPGLWAQHLILPAVTLGIPVAAELTRHLRASLGDVLMQDYIRTANAKGLGGTSVVYKHAMRNASLPVLTVLGVQIAKLLGATVIVEQVFNMPGIGQLVVQAVFNRDFPIVLGVGLFTAAIVLVINLLVDWSYSWLNPKTK